MGHRATARFHKAIFSSDNGSILTISMNKIMYQESAPLGKLKQDYENFKASLDYIQSESRSVKVRQ